MVSTSGSSGRRLHLRHIHIYSILYVSLCTCDMYPEIDCAWPPLVFAAKHQNSQINGGMKHHSIFQKYSELMCQIEDPREIPEVFSNLNKTPFCWMLSLGVRSLQLIATKRDVERHVQNPTAAVAERNLN